MKDKNRDQKIAKLLELINNPRGYREYKHLAFNIHEEVIFPLELLNQLYKIKDLISYASFDQANPDDLQTRIMNLASVVDPYYSQSENNTPLDDETVWVNKCILISQINTHIAFALQNSDFVDINRIL